MEETVTGEKGVSQVKKPDYRTLWGCVDQEIKWLNAFVLFASHAFLVYFLLWKFLYYSHVNTYPIFLFQVAFGYLFCAFGVTAGAHRYYTHRCYKAKLPLRVLLIMAYSASSQNKLLDWVRDHRVHHKYSDTHADPHNSNRGFFFSHCGWLMMKKRPEVIEKGRNFDYSDILTDPLVQFHHKYFVPLWVMNGYVIPIMFCMYVLGYSFWVSFGYNVMRWLMQLHITWSVNSAAHLWGNRPYDQKICPVESRLVSLMTSGEGWHNYHHTFPWDYKASEWAYYINLTTVMLHFFERIGWAYDLKEPTKETIRRTVEKFGDGSHYVWGRDEVTEDGRILKHE